MDYTIAACDHIGITVSDMDRAIRFFRDVLGARIGEPRYYDDPAIGKVNGFPGALMTIGHAFVGGYSFELLQYHTPDDRRSSDLRPCDSGHIHLALKVHGIEALVARMEREGFVATGPVQRVGARGLAASYLCGFDRFVIELLEDAAPAA